MNKASYNNRSSSQPFSFGDDDTSDLISCGTYTSTYTTNSSFNTTSTAVTNMTTTAGSKNSKSKSSVVWSSLKNIGDYNWSIEGSKDTVTLYNVIYSVIGV